MADYIMEDDTLRFTGRLTLARIGDLPQRLREQMVAPRLIDLGQIERMDSVGAWVVHRLVCDSGAEIIGSNTTYAHLLAQVSAHDRPVAEPPPRQPPLINLLGQVGNGVISALQTLVGLTGFMGAIILEIYAIIGSPTRFRWAAMIRQFEDVGVRAISIIGLMSVLIGVVIAEQSAEQLADYGGQAFTINIIGSLTLRELGVLMTAIMVAGRSGSAFAAQLGTMKLTEEIDAMRTIGISPIGALVLPRV
ncbi:MAG: ABC transporter permease, partial [Alphaproteobacteria bacterium]|nr:ABC transporter permease [Alphaproteobacteria bacterium]